MALEGALHYPSVFDLLIQHTSDDIDVTEVRVRNTRLAGSALRRIRLPGDALVLSLQRDGSVMVPHGDTRLELDDIVGLIGSPTSLDQARSLLNS
jgi:Trk K+ transport system NAD-binding subunit